MKIALIGYGRMGRAIEQIASDRGHQVILKVTSSNQASLHNGDLKDADVAIEFTKPECAVSNINACFDSNVPVVCGTTGWLDRLKDVKHTCDEKDQALLYASNFSIGVNLFFAINTYAARLFSSHRDYKVAIEEIHHIHKLDSPSGTGITLAENIMSQYGNLDKWVLDKAPSENELQIRSVRSGEVPGTHTTFFTSEIDTVELRHTAHNRKGFAMGAVIAAEWLQNKKGCFTMQDVLNLPTPDGSDKK